MKRHKTKPKGFILFRISVISCGSMLFSYFLTWMLVADYITLYNLDLLMSAFFQLTLLLLEFASVVAVVATFAIALFLLIKDVFKHMGEPVKIYRVLTLMAIVFSAIILLITWQYHPNNLDAHRKIELQDIANMQIIADKIHSGEQLPTYSYSKYLIRVEGEPGHEDIFFYKVNYGKSHPHGYYKGYLYSEDDICDMYFADLSVDDMRSIQDNWYYISVHW